MPSLKRFSAARWLVALLGLHCGSSTPATPAPPNVAGVYTVAVTSHANACLLGGWDVGGTVSNIPFTVTQTGTMLMGTFDGTTGMTLDAFLGSDTLTGGSSGDQLDFTLDGDNVVSLGNCMGTLNVLVAAHLTGNSIVGEITFTLAANSDPNCASLGICESAQSFTGTRPTP